MTLIKQLGIVIGLLTIGFCLAFWLMKEPSKPTTEIEKPEQVITKGQHVSSIESCKLYRLESKEGTFIYWSVCTDTIYSDNYYRVKDHVKKDGFEVQQINEQLYSVIHSNSISAQ